ncbi:MAG: methylenetetrahydrofolate--tRNA-(uracil(54)-C(5))-methyltransferase (FADH(2)-oxidizing) TrmFO [Oscillospiraceae bacterium]|jgi:methylenetetrahydrofolate--tRNA-(uracil-5-)-methyltransferase|nr:methylenetetrahydrofolate--tRNA-(uracil(54)-C(5))-methyltransferase (FADH(2)-oxidizing) TrmFO [Oscillospiraceae bacterium]
MKRAAVVGAGLAGCEAAWQLARRGVPVDLIEMKPRLRTPAHESPLFAELVCSNSLKSNALTNASGLLKEEMRRVGSLIMQAADATRVPAGGALAVDRGLFARYVTDALAGCPSVRIVSEEVCSLPDAPAIIATGPLTSPALSDAIAALPGLERLYFFDAAAPIVTGESIDRTRAFEAARYDKGDGDYLNCPMTEAEYDAFIGELLCAETAPVHGFEEDRLYEGCMPVESIARRGRLALAYGPMRPVGLIDPRAGRRPFAVVQLRRENAEGTLWNLVGFQTRLRFGEQKRVFGMIPGLERAEFARYGVMHRNTYLHSPSILNERFEARGYRGLYFAGQITGVEGYLPSAASGLIAGISLARDMLALAQVVFPGCTALGALGRYVSSPNKDYQPMGIQYGLIDTPEPRIRNKRLRAERVAERSLETIENIRRALEEEIT